MSQASKNLIHNTETAKTISRRVQTVTTECFFSVFENVLGAEYGKDWFSILVGENEDILANVKDIYSCNLITLLKIILNDTPCSRIIATKSESPKEFLSSAEETFKCLEYIANNEIYNEESEHYSRAALNMVLLVDFFPSVRDEDNATYASRVVFRSAPLVSDTERKPAYSVAKTIEKYNLSITVGEFIDFCNGMQTEIIVNDDELCFAPQNYDGFIKEVMKTNATKNSASIKHQRNIKLIKMAVVIIVLISIVLSSIITYKITDALKGKNNGGNDNSVSSQNTSSDAQSSKNDTSSKIESDTSSSFESQVSSTTESTVSSENVSSAAPSVDSLIPQKTVDENGRITETVVIPYIYDGNNYVIYNSNIEEQDTVYVKLSSYYFDSWVDKQNIGIRIYNDTDDVIRNLVMDFTIISENNTEVLHLNQMKIMENNSSVSVAAQSSYYHSLNIPLEDVVVPDADLGVFKTKVSISYDILK